MLFTEKLRPKTWDKLILLPRVRDCLKNGLVQNILMYSTSPGSGKSSTARLLIEGHDTLKLNGSSENGIDVIREEVTTFASTLSLEEDQDVSKVVYIDEADGLSPQAWDALRETIERYADNVRFVCTCNKIDKIPQPIQSRFNCIPFFPLNKDEEMYLMTEYCKKIGALLGALNINYTQEALEKLIKDYFPDLRSVINVVQSMYIGNATELNPDAYSKTFDYSDLFNAIVNNDDPVNNYKFVKANYENNEEDALMAISKDFIEFIRTSHEEYNPKIPYLIITIAEHVNQLATSIDKTIVLLSCFFKLQEVLKR